MPEGLPAALHHLSLPEVAAGFYAISFTISRQSKAVQKQKESIMQSFPWF